MRYSIGEVNVFKRDSHDVDDRCKKLFENWLTTGHGPEPKTYRTLLKCIKDVDKLTAASEAVEKELIKGNGVTSCGVLEKGKIYPIKISNHKPGTIPKFSYVDLKLVQFDHISKNGKFFLLEVCSI